MPSNAYIQLKVKEDGTYMEMIPAESGGSPLNSALVEQYLNMVFNGKYEQTIVRDELAHTLAVAREVLVTSDTSRQNIDEMVVVAIAPDRMKAIGNFFPPVGGGLKMTKEDIVSSLIKSGVKYGVNEEAIETFFKDRKYLTPFVLAKATPQEEGKDAEIIYYFNTDISRKPRVNEDGTVDFHHLDMISAVQKGACIAELHPAILGKNGIDVCGGLLRPVKVKQRVLRIGKNIKLSEDSLKAFSEVNGHATIEGEQIFVSDQYEVPANVDASTGDISYEGNVLVHGNVMAGYVVQAKGDVVVEGVVEGAVIEAGGQIVLKRGIQGMEKGVLKAGGNIVSKFIENATVDAGGYITADAIMHSNVTAVGDITVDGKKGFISGGVIRSTSMVSARTIGSNMGTTTVIEVGINPQVMNEYHDLQKELVENQENTERVTLILTGLIKRLKLEGKLPPDKLLQLKHEKANRENLIARAAEVNTRLNELKTQIDSYDGGVVRVNGNVFTGCKIVISNAVYYVRDDLSFCRFEKEFGEVKCNSYY